MRMLITGYTLTIAMACAGTLATAQPNLATRSETVEPMVPPSADQPAHVLCVTRTPGYRPTVPMHPTIRTRWVLIDPVVNYEFGTRNDYNDELDARHQRWLSIQPLTGAIATSLLIETTVPQTFQLTPVPDASQAVSMVIILATDPATGEPIPDARCKKRDAKPELGDDRTIVQVEEHFDTYPPKTARFVSGGYILEGRITEQHRQGDTLVCRYRLLNEGLSYAAKEAQILPLGSEEPLDAVVAIDGDKTFPIVLGHDNVLTGAIHVKSSAAALENGFKLRLLPTGIGVPAVMGFEEEPANVGRLAVQAHGILGAISLRASPSSSETDFTALSGVGLRGLYGLTKHLSGEVELSVLSTGDAEFDDASTVDAITTRVSVGGVLHTGETYVPYFRAGLGGRLSSYRSVPSSGESSSDLRTGGLFYLGGGAEAHVGEHFVAGFSVGFVSSLGGGDDSSTSFEAGLHLGYAWKP